jgi:hypothetical protein
LSGKKQNHIAARDFTSSPHDPKKTKLQAAILFFFIEDHTCHISKVPSSHNLFYQDPMKQRNAQRNNTQDQMQQHTRRPNATAHPPSQLWECFHIDATSKLRKQLLLNDAGMNQCHRQTGKQMGQVMLDRPGPAI